MTHGSLSTPSPREQRVDASFSTTAAAAESRGTHPRACSPPVEGAASAAGSAPSSGTTSGSRHAVEVDRVQLRSNAGANRHAALQTRARVTRAAAAAAGEVRDRQGSRTRSVVGRPPAGRREARAPSRQHSARNNCADASRSSRRSRTRPPGPPPRSERCSSSNAPPPSRPARSMERRTASRRISDFRATLHRARSGAVGAVRELPGAGIGAREPGFCRRGFCGCGGAPRFSRRARGSTDHTFARDSLAPSLSPMRPCL